MEPTKICSKCKRELPLSAFSKDKSKKDSLTRQCKYCVSLRTKKYRENNFEKISAKKKQYYEDNHKKISAYGKQRYENNREKVSAYGKQYNENNREKISAKKKQYRENNREKISARTKQYRENNYEKVSAREKQYRENNSEKINTGTRECSNLYIKRLLLKRDKTCVITPELIELKREQILIQRLTHQLNQAVKEKQNDK